MAKKNGRDSLAHLVELMTEQVAETRLMREDLGARVDAVALSNVEIRDEIRSLNVRVSRVVDRVSRLVPGRIVEFGWLGADGTTSWHPAVVLEVHRAQEAPQGATLDLEVFGVDPADRRRFPTQAISGENAGCWRFSDA